MPHLTQLHDDEQAAVPAVQEALPVVDDVGVLQCSQQVHLITCLHVVRDLIGASSLLEAVRMHAAIKPNGQLTATSDRQAAAAARSIKVNMGRQTASSCQGSMQL